MVDIGNGRHRAGEKSSIASMAAKLLCDVAGSSAIGEPKNRMDVVDLEVRVRRLEIGLRVLASAAAAHASIDPKSAKAFWKAWKKAEMPYSENQRLWLKRLHRISSAESI